MGDSFHSGRKKWGSGTREGRAPYGFLDENRSKSKNAICAKKSKTSWVAEPFFGCFGISARNFHGGRKKSLNADPAGPERQTL
jgi:hypothetical protein